MGTRIEKTDLARDALYEKVNQIADEKVSLEGNETITGAKTFTQWITQRSGDPKIQQKNIDCTKGTAPSSLEVMALQFMDKNSNLLGTVQTNYETDKDVYTELRVYKANNASDTAVAKLGVGYNNGSIYTYCPQPTDTTSTNGEQIATTGWVNSANNNVVHKTNNETISGNKTFSDNLVKQSNSLDYKGIHIQNTQLTKGTTPNTSVGGQFVFQAKDGLGLTNRIGGVEVSYDSSGNIASRLLACQPVANSTTYASISVIYPKTGNPYTVCPTPTDTTTGNGTQIATTGWVNSGNNNVVHKSGDETITGTKTFTSNLNVTKNTASINLNNSNFKQGTPPASGEVNSFVFFTDKNGANVGSLKCAYRNDGVGYTQLIANKHDGSAGSPTLGIYCDANNNAYTDAPTPETSDNSRKIATTAYVNNKFKKVSTLPASPDANTFYFIPE